MISSMWANVDVIKPRDLFDGRPGFFAALEGAGVESKDVGCVATRGIGDS